MEHICIGKQKDYPCEQCEIIRLRTILEVYEGQIAESAAVYAERDRLRAIVARVEDVEKLAEIIKDSHHTHWGNPSVTPVRHAARAVRDYALKEGK